MRTIILASGSPRRKELLTQAGIRYEVRVSGADENLKENDPKLLVKKLSAQKAEAVFRQFSEEQQKDAVIIGADTVVYHNSRILGKPADASEAFAMISDLQGKTHQVYTGVTLLSSDCRVSFCETTDVSVYPMNEEEINCYLATGEPYDKAGGYGIQGRFCIYVRAIRGDYNTVVGLPVARLVHELRKAGLYD